MFISGSATSGTVKEERPEVTDKITLARLLHGLSSVYEKLLNITVGMEARRYRDPREHDPDYGHRLHRLEGDISDSEPHFRIDRYDEGSGGTSWQKWILGIVSVSLVGMLSWALGKLDTLNQEVATLQATQTMGFGAIAQRQTADEQRIDRIESHVFRGSP